MNSRRNVRLLKALLGGSASILLTLSILVKGQPARTILLTLGVTMLVATIIQWVIYEWKPETFRKKAEDPD